MTIELEVPISSKTRPSERSLTLLFGITLFVSAALLFSVQPMVAKMLLPLLGGTPAVWNTCMLFFQAALLAGYAYALIVSRWQFRQQLALQLLLLALAFVILPIGLSPSWINSLDAFSSDAIPIHLITQQAIDLYLSKLVAGGLLVFHISNRNLDLSPVVADLAHSRNLSCIALGDSMPNPVEGKDPSVWVVMARSPSDLEGLPNSSNARVLNGDSRRPVFTDDFSNILSVFRWR
jgi:hypothetical protein